MSIAIADAHARALHKHALVVRLRALRRFIPHARKVGGIWFWRVGNVGGSFYVARNR